MLKNNLCVAFQDHSTATYSVVIYNLKDRSKYDYLLFLLPPFYVFGKSLIISPFLLPPFYLFGNSLITLFLVLKYSLDVVYILVVVILFVKVKIIFIWVLNCLIDIHVGDILVGVLFEFFF